MSQVIHPRIDEMRRQLKKRGRKNRRRYQKLRESIQIAKWKHFDTPGFAR